ncbi:hypothetical protein QBC38DRAFT_494573 [Podospora fimiseda]|uniref:Uncharacterized protein n=1 Tax=Podospora fimiseda TaxID=252190 RepID=A0AAN7H932_9PEZI|nr:hypothetical protein QBC38DRAFT_494573 [Podospora fimiseda]
MKWNPFSLSFRSSKPDPEAAVSSSESVEKQPPPPGTTTSGPDPDLETGLPHHHTHRRQTSTPKPYLIPSIPPPLLSPRHPSSTSPRRVSPSLSLSPPPSHRTSRTTTTSRHSRKKSKSTSPYRPTTSPDPDILPILPPPKNTPLSPTPQITTHQLLYLLIISSLLPCIISSLINFSIAYFLYKPYSQITLWAFPSTLAGDAAVTIVLTCISTWFIEYFLVRRDLSTGGIAPFGWIEEESIPGGRFISWFLFLGEEGLGKKWGEWLIGQFMRIAVLILGCMITIWPGTVGILMLVGERKEKDWIYKKESWTPELFKLVLGGVLGAVVTPVMAGVWLVRGGLRSN